MIDLGFVKKELEKFKYINFLEEPHIYTYVENEEQKNMGTSVTTLVHSYSNPFNEDLMSKITAKKTNSTQKEVLEKWKLKKEIACYKGTLTHLFNENLWKDGTITSYDYFDVLSIFGKDVLKDSWEKLTKICKKWYNDNKERLIIIGLELVVGSKKYNIAGSIDFLVYSKKLDKIIFLDYKTNEEIAKESYYDKKKKKSQMMLYPLDYIPDCNYYHYSLQLAIYKKIILEETNIPIDWICNKKWLVWIHEDNDDYVLYECVDMDKEAAMILKIREN